MIHRCPRCFKTTFEQLVIFNVELDRCTNCKGIWMDGGEYEKIIECAHHNQKIEFENINKLKQLREESFQPLRVSCPGCEKSLLDSAPVYFEFIHHVVITDRCVTCKGVWLDEYELSLILKYMKKEDMAIGELAKKELKKQEESLKEMERDAILTGKKNIDRRTFFKTLFGV